MNLTLRQVQVFEAAARCGSFTRAAAELYLTQPAVSMQIKQLEVNLGLPLFEHLGKRTYLTAAGYEFLAYSRRLTALLHEMEEVIEGFKGIRRGRLLVSVATTANHFATRMLAEFARRYEGLSLRLDVSNRESLLKQLENNECDLVIMGQPPDKEDFEAVPFLANPLVVIGSRQHPLAGLLQVPLARLAEESLLLREVGSGTRSAALRVFEQAGVPVKLGMEMRSSEAIKQAVEAGLGVAVVSLHTLELELSAQRLSVLDVAGFPLKRHWYLVQRRDKRLSAAALAFRTFVLAEAQAFVNLPGTEPSVDDGGQ